MKKYFLVLSLPLFFLSCNTENRFDEQNKLTSTDLNEISQIGERHNQALNNIYLELQSKKENSTIFLREIFDPREMVYTNIAAFGSSIYNNEELMLFTEKIETGESNFTQALDLDKIEDFTTALTIAFSEVKNELMINNLHSDNVENYLESIKIIMINSQSDSVDFFELKDTVSNKFIEISNDNVISSTQKAILLSTLTIYDASLSYWYENLDSWYELNSNESSRVSEPRMDYGVIACADAIGALRGAYTGAASGALVGGIGAVPGAICGALAGGATGSALAAGAQLLKWAWTSIW